MATGGEDDRALLFDLEKSGELVNAICKLTVFVGTNLPGTVFLEITRLVA